MVAMKRDLRATRDHRLYDVKGVVSYARSLLQSCRRMDYINKESYEHELQFVDNMKSSIETLVQNDEREIAKNIASSNAARSVVLLIFAIAAPFVLLNRELISKGIGEISGPELLPETLTLIFVKFAGTTNGLIIITGLLLATYFFYKSIINCKYGSVLLFLKGAGRFFAYITNSIYLGYVVLVITLILGFGFILKSLFLILYN